MKSIRTSHNSPFIIALVILSLFPLGAMSEEPGAEQGNLKRFLGRIETSALIEGEWALGTGQGRSQKLELIFEPEVEIKLPFRSDLTAIGRGRGDLFDELEPGDPSQDEVSRLSRRLMVGNQTDFELREFYIEHRFGRTFLTIGKQQIVWGKADGLKVLDVVNPQDFREFILDDFEDSRIPLWGINIEIPVEEIDVQLIWIPDQTYHELPEEDATFAFTSPLLIPRAPSGITVDLRAPEKPSRFFLDSDAGIRLSTFWRGWDLTLNYLYHYHDLPVLFQELAISPGGPIVTITPRYERTHLAGGTFSNAFGDLTVRGEVGFSFNRFFLAEGPTDPDGVVKTDELAYVLGFDWYGLSETLISAQLFQSWVTENRSKFVRDEVDTSVTLLLQREFLNDRVVTELLWLHNLNQDDGLVRPKASYELRDNIKIWTGADVFYGTQHGLFGQFDQKDRFILGFEWGV